MRFVRSFLTGLVRWFDSWAGAEALVSEEDARTDRIDWIRCMPFLGLHLACLAIIWVGVSWIAVTVCVALYIVRMFAITGFYHRYFSHRAFKAPRAVQFAMGVIGATATQRGPLWWAAHHRHHHRFSDQPEDVHSPLQHGFLWSHVGWITSRRNFPTKLALVPDLAKFPELRFLDRFDTLIPILFASSLFFLGMLLAALYPELGTSGLQMLVWGFVVSTVLLFHGTFTINSLCHVFGRRRYETSDTSRNSLLLALITLGEGWHNNHHYYQASARQGFRWFELDITYYGLRLMALLGLVRDLKPVPAAVVAAGRRLGPPGRVPVLEPAPEPVQ